jgi:hypothetical protein
MSELDNKDIQQDYPIKEKIYNKRDEMMKMMIKTSAEKMAKVNTQRKTQNTNVKFVNSALIKLLQLHLTTNELIC